MERRRSEWGGLGALGVVYRPGVPAASLPPFRLLAPLLRWRYPVVALTAFASCLQHLRGTGRDWDYFVEGSELLVGRHHLYTLAPGGLRLYANYPRLQIGPLSLLVATPLRLLGPDDGRVVASLVMTACVVLFVYVLERTARVLWPDALPADVQCRSLTVLLGGVVAALAWSPLATIYMHLDDVLALGACVGALWAVATKRPVVLGLCIGAAAAAKPWGVLALPLVLALRGRARWVAFATGAAVTAAAWLPFVLADRRTLTAVTPQNVVSPASILHLFGVAAADGPSWTRPVQLVAVLTVGVVAVSRGRWAAVFLVGVAVRLALDPQVFLYYTAGLVLAALSWDLLRTRRPLPVWTCFAFVLLDDATALVPDPTARAVLRLFAIVVMVGAVLFAPVSGSARPSSAVGSRRWGRAPS